jgi:hypothetical protein
MLQFYVHTILSHFVLSDYLCYSVSQSTVTKRFMDILSFLERQFCNLEINVDMFSGECSGLLSSAP